MQHTLRIRYNWSERGETKWLFWLEKKLQELGFDVVVEPLPEFKADQKPEIVREIQSAHGIAEHDTVVIPHDPGCLSLLKYCERLLRSGKTDPTLLIAAVPRKNYSTTGSAFVQLEGARGLRKIGESNALNTNGSSDSQVLTPLEASLLTMNVKLMIVYGGTLPELEQNKMPMLAGGSRAQKSSTKPGGQKSVAQEARNQRLERSFLVRLWHLFWS